MQKIMKRAFSLRQLIFIICFSTLLICAETGKVSAKSQYPYLIKVNRVYNTVTIYQQDQSGKYNVPIKSMLCSVGAKGKTKTGTYQTKGKYRWKLLMGDVWGQYSTRIVKGVLFHSVYYYGKMDPSTLASSQFNRLGSSASHGCVRLSVADAKWIYDNCSVGTTVIIYDDKKTPGPLGKPEAIKINTGIRWDPTDPAKENPYHNKKPVITGAGNLKTDWQEKVNLLKGIKAKSSLGMNITSDVSVKGKVNYNTPGKYKVTYSVKDALGRTAKQEIFVTVKKNDAAPDLKGIKDKVVKAGTEINKEFALSGIKAYCSGKKYSQKIIKVTIEKVSEEEYDITYRANVGEGPFAVKKSKVYIDGIAPVFSGIADRTLEEGTVIDNNYLMNGVTVSDNRTAQENIEVNVTYVQNQDGSYAVTYEAEDEVGNKTMEQSVINIDNKNVLE